ncbi:MAG: WD40 repeat domain-containing protein, partial [bacterium]|nr:WD40 repeat domain-containing protein [bacterium]
MTSRALAWSGPALIAALSVTLAAQCETRWQNTVGVSGVNGSVHDTVMWDPDGSGPRTPVWVVVGSFTAAGTITANHVATYDPANGQWGTLDTGLDREALALAVLPNNDLVVGGRFRSAGGVPVERVARWNGSTWSAVGAGLPNRIEVTELAMDASGGLLAAAGVIGWPTSTSEVMRWDGTNWSPTGMTCAGVIHALEPLATGEVIVGGSFATSGTTPTGGIARWDGTTWHDYGSGVGPVFGTQGSVRALTIAANGDLVIGGFFVGVSGAGASNLARWNGNSWAAFSGPGTGSVSMLRTMPTGDLIVGASSVSNGGIAHSGIARYDGTNWHSIGSGTDGSATSLAIAPNGDWLVSGLSIVGGIAAGNVARWNGTSWQTIGNGLGGAVDALTTMANDDLVVTGDFLTAGNVSANRIARWDGSTWSAIGNGFDGRAYAVTTLPNGDIIAGGDFDHSGGQAISALARWDGTLWSALGSGLAIAPFPPIVLALATRSNGDLIVAGAFASAGGTSGPSVARWDGSNWHAMGNEATASGVYALANSTTDELFASGAFLINGLQHNGVAHWNGSTWTAVGGEFDFPPEALAVSPSGEIWAGGRFDQAEGNPVESLARWNGTGWVQVGGGIALNSGDTVDAITFLPDGDALVLGNFLFAGGQRVDHVARWDGSTWTAVDGGL